jgi:hypothetical protein
VNGAPYLVHEMRVIASSSQALAQMPSHRQRLIWLASMFGIYQKLCQHHEGVPIEEGFADIRSAHKREKMRAPPAFVPERAEKRGAFYAITPSDIASKNASNGGYYSGTGFYRLGFSFGAWRRRNLPTFETEIGRLQIVGFLIFCASGEAANNKTASRGACDSGRWTMVCAKLLL